MLSASIEDGYEGTVTIAQTGSRSQVILSEHASLVLEPPVRHALETGQSIAGLTAATALTLGGTRRFGEFGVAALTLVPIGRGDRCSGRQVWGSGEFEPFPSDTRSLFADRLTDSDRSADDSGFRITDLW